MAEIEAKLAAMGLELPLPFDIRRHGLVAGRRLEGTIIVSVDRKILL